ncbi:MAG TPA: methyltransferase domain-containing protein [Polyangiaceae bacterium]|nr:methyltransferase domain-containing protein [Polyangiaceae bacterium]
MTSLDSRFVGSIPEIYDGILVPMIFEVYAKDLAEQVANSGALAVLETAAGTGALTRALAARLSTAARLLATDLNQPMLDYGAARAPADARVSRRQADALALPYEGETFDAVACQFGVMFFPDKVQGYCEARRVLRPGGRFVFNVWDALSENTFPSAVSEALADYFPHDPPRFMQRTPHGYYDLDQIRRQLELAGFTLVTAEAADHVSRARSARDIAVAFCQGTPLRNEIEARNPGGLEAATDHVAEAVARRFGEGACEGKLRAILVTAQA